MYIVLEDFIFQKLIGFFFLLTLNCEHRNFFFFWSGVNFTPMSFSSTSLTVLSILINVEDRHFLFPRCFYDENDLPQLMQVLDFIIPLQTLFAGLYSDPYVRNFMNTLTFPFLRDII